MTITPEAMSKRWNHPGFKLISGKLIDNNGFCCPQGDVLRVAGRSDQYINGLHQQVADVEVAQILGISKTHSILLRFVNDFQTARPQDVLSVPERVLGVSANRVLMFWSKLDVMGSGELRDVARRMAGQSGSIISCARRAIEEGVEEEACLNLSTTHGDYLCVEVTNRSMLEFPTLPESPAKMSLHASLCISSQRLSAATAGYAALEIQAGDYLQMLGLPLFFLPMFGVEALSELDAECET